MNTIRLVCFILLALPGAAWTASLDELTAKMQQMEREMDEMRAEINAARAEATAARENLDPDAVKRAADEYARQVKAEEIHAGTLAEAKPVAEITNADRSAMTRKKLLEDGLLPGYKTFADTNTQFKVGGFVRVDTYKDFNRTSPSNIVGTFASFTLTDDQPGEGENGDFHVTTQTTRLNLDTRTPTPWAGDGFEELNVFIEGDWWSGSDPENQFRIRHAYGKWGNLMVGKTWPMFAPLEAMPATFDFAGAVASVPIRENEIRWDQPFGDRFRLGINATKPGGEITIPTDAGGVPVAQVNDTVPDIFLRGIYEDDWGHVKASTVYRRLGVDGRAPGVDDDDEIGWMAYLSGAFLLGDGKYGAQNKLGWGATYGDGFSHWRTALGGLNQDAVLTSSGLETVESYGGFVAYDHHWSERLTSSFMASVLDADNPDEAPGSAIKDTYYGMANVIWSPLPLIDIGLEYTTVHRENENGAEGDIHRLNLVMIWKFHEDAPTTEAYRDFGYILGGHRR